MLKVDCSKPIRYNNKKYHNLRALADSLQINFYTLKSRLQTGKSIDEACSIPVRKNKPIKVNGKKFKSINGACEYFNVDPRHTLSKINKGWTIDEAFGILPRTKAPKYVVKGKSFFSMSDLAAYYKCERTTVKKRLDNGWSLEEALELVKRKATAKCNGKLYVIRNTVNRKRYYGITTGSLKHRFNRHKQQSLENSDTKLYRAIRKYGIQNFYIELVKETNSREHLRRLEIKYINHYNTIEKGYNTILGGGHLGDKFGISVQYKDVTYPSISSLAGYLGISPCSLNYRLRTNQFKGVTMIRSSPALVN